MDPKNPDNLRCISCEAAPGEAHRWYCDRINRMMKFKADNPDGPWTAYHASEPEPTDEGEATQPDIIVKPSHYTRWKIEPITFIMRNGFEFWRGNIVKYVSRAGSKLYDGMDATQSEITDLKKVIRYAEMRINQLQGEEEL